MRVYAWMTAFTGHDGEPTMLRPIDIRDTWPGMAEHPLEDDEYPAAVLNGAFHFGQNDFQPRRCPSLSVGDVIEVPAPGADDPKCDWESPTYWRVESIGFTSVSQPDVVALDWPHFLDHSDEDARCPSCLTGDPFHPVEAHCEGCRDAAQSIVERAETRAGWDATP
jgi:hypothetical protein